MPHPFNGIGGTGFCDPVKSVMRLTRFGVTLARLERKRLDTVRCWRNSSWVRPNMRQQHYIQPDEQAQWFESLDPHCDWYFVAELNDKIGRASCRERV